jgi:TRAP-type C4-dicarboxylate transport system substrate-binding protein
LQEVQQETSKKALIAAGVKFIEPNEIKKKSFVDAVKPVWEKFSSTPQEKAMVQKILNTK